MVITLSNAYSTSTISLNSGTICGYTDTKNILIFRLNSPTEIEEKIGEFRPFVNTYTTVNVEGKINYHLTPIDIKYNDRSICYEFTQGDLSWN